MPSILGYLLLVCASACLCGVGASKCSWSNEGCKHDEECCSSACYKVHDGTNPRCRHSSIGERCVFSYHCQDGLECGPHYNCCSSYWKMCVKDSDCCSEMHVCLPAEGFIYNRCLFPNSASRLFLTSGQLQSSVALALVVTLRVGLSGWVWDVR